MWAGPAGRGWFQIGVATYRYCTNNIVHSYEWWWLQHPSKDDEACAISGKRTTNSKLNTSIIGGCGVGVRIVDFFSNIRA